METKQTDQQALTVINPNIQMSLWQALPPTLQVAIRTSGSVQSLEEVVSLTTEPKLAKLQKCGGERATFGVVKALLVAMNNNLHLDNHLTEGEIIKIARRLTTDPELRWWLTLADIDLLCRRIAEGYFGHFYNHFSELEFNTCLAKYCQERAELHRLEADKTVTNTSEDKLKMSELGYSLGPDGQLIVPDEAKERTLPQPLYRYDDKGKRIGINPNGAFGKKQAAVSDTNNVMFLVKKMMKADRNLDLDEAIDMAKAQLNKSNTGGGGDSMS